MRDVAEAAGVSRTTVSFVLNNIPNTNIPEATRQRVRQVAQTLDYVPNAQALNLATGRTMTIGFVIRQTSEQVAVDAFLGGLFHGIMQSIEPRGYHLLLHAAEPGSPDNTYGQLVRTRKVDGLMISSPLVNDADVRLLHDEGTPIVLHGASDSDDIPSVDVDNTQGGYLATQHLIELGHRRIGFISNAPFTYASGTERWQGYKWALAETGIPYDETLVQQGEFTDASGHQAMEVLLDLPEPPTAVFVASDVVALGALEAIRNRGLSVPDDLSVIGFDDIPLSKYLNLTTVHLPAIDLGRTGGETILKIIKGESLPSVRTLLRSELIVRGSTAAVPK